MSIKIMNAVFETDLEPKHKIVMLVLADHSDVDGYCWPGQATISRRTSIPERTLRRILTDLEEQGLIQRERRADESGRRKTDGYRLAATLAGGSPTGQDAAPTGQNGTANRPAVAGTKEPSEEPSVDTPPTPSWQDELFEQLWESWPKKSAKKDARRAFDRMCKSQHGNATQITNITTLLARHGAEHRKHTPPQFQPMLSTIINGERWNDPLPVSRERGAYKPEPQQAATPKIPFGHRPVWNADGYIVGSEPIE